MDVEFYVNEYLKSRDNLINSIKLINKLDIITIDNTQYRFLTNQSRMKAYNEIHKLYTNLNISLSTIDVDFQNEVYIDRYLSYNDEYFENIICDYLSDKYLNSVYNHLKVQTSRI